MFTWLRQWREERRRVKRLLRIIEALERDQMAREQMLTDLHVKYIEVVKQAPATAPGGSDSEEEAINGELGGNPQTSTAKR